MGYEDGDGLAIDALRQGVGELGPPRTLLRPFPSRHETVLHQLGQVYPQSIVREPDFRQDLLKIFWFTIP
jgi:hypothetical protein